MIHFCYLHIFWPYTGIRLWPNISLKFQILHEFTPVLSSALSPIHTPVRTSPHLFSFVCICLTEDVATVNLVLQLKYTEPALSDIRPMTPICNNTDKQLK